MLEDFNDSYVDCPVQIPRMRNRSRVIRQNDKIYLGSNYVRCDLGGTYCGFKIENQTVDMCAAECFFLKYRYSGTMNEYVSSSYE